MPDIQTVLYMEGLKNKWEDTDVILTEKDNNNSGFTDTGAGMHRQIQPLQQRSS